MSANAPSPALSSDQQRALLRDLLDDASLFPPGNLPMPQAVSAHVAHETAWFSDLTGPFVCPETRLAELGTALTASGVPWIDLSLVVTGGAAAGRGGGPSRDPGIAAVRGDPLFDALRRWRSDQPASIGAASRPSRAAWARTSSGEPQRARPMAI